MKKKILFIGLLIVALVGGIIYAADHIDAPAVTGTGSTSLAADITDIYAFQDSTDNSKMVLVMNTQGLLSPAASAAAAFPSNVLYEFNIDNNGNNVEDLVIQCLVQNGKIRVYGPVAPASTGTTSTIVTSAGYVEANITPYGATIPTVGTNASGMKVFAGPRDDPFFFDLTRFKEILGGTATAFHTNIGTDLSHDAFAGTNVMSIVVEVPKSMLGTGTSINIWGETKTK